MRTDNSIKNSITAVVANLVAFIVAFVAQAIFIKILGAEYLGLNGLFTNVLTMLGIFELGIGNAIVFELYKPISKNDKEKIKSLMFFYKKAYRAIASIIFFVGIAIIPFLKYIVGSTSVDVNIFIVYCLFLVSTVTSYFMVYKRNLIIAMQRNYIINIIHMIYLVFVNVLQLIVLFWTKNYYLYLIIKIGCQLLENFVITMIANKDYPYLKEKEVKKLDKTLENDIFSRVKALFFHKIGYIVVSGTDNIIISSFLGLIQVGLYTNYYTVINAINTLFAQVINSTTASVGNLLVTENDKKVFDTFKKIRFFNFWIACFSAVCLLTIIQPFIVLWIGKDYLLPIGVVYIIIFNYFQKMMRNTYATFKDSAGIWIEDKYIPIIEAILNVVFSILFLKIFGLAGVFLGTIISGLVLWCYSYPKFVYKKIFKGSYIDYMKETLGYIALFLIIECVTYLIASFIVVNNIFVKVIINTIISLIVPNLLMYTIFRKTSNYKYFEQLVGKILKKLVIRNKNV